MNKVFLLFLLFLLPAAFSLKVDQFVSFPGEKTVIEFDSEVYAIEMSKYYNLAEVKDCTEKTCPLFENNSLKDSGKKKFVLAIGDSRPGFYAVKVFENDANNFYFTSVVVRTDYRLLIGFGIAVFIALIFLVERNESEKQ